MESEQISIGPECLAGELHWQADSLGMVVFAHGSGSSRGSPRNRHVASVLHGYHLGTLLFDLLTEAEAADRQKVFDITLLASRLIRALDWLRPQSRFSGARIGLFGASTGAAAAFRAGAQCPARISAIVSRGGRPDLAGDALAQVQAPSLLIVGGDDVEVLRLNRQAMRELTCQKRLEAVPGASHLFEEPGTLDTVAHLAGVWFRNHLTGGAMP